MPILQSSVDAVATVGKLKLGGFQTITGGEITAESVKDRPPGAHFDQALRSPASVGNITLSRTWDEGRDGQVAKVLRSVVGTGEGTITRVRRDAYGNQIGGTTYNVILVRVTDPEGNTNAAGDKAVFELEFVVDGAPA